jgi:hypothetical protein
VTMMVKTMTKEKMMKEKIRYSYWSTDYYTIELGLF